MSDPVEETTRLPATIHFPSGWRRWVCVKLIVLVTWLLGGRVVRHD